MIQSTPPPPAARVWRVGVWLPGSTRRRTPPNSLECGVNENKRLLPRPHARIIKWLWAVWFSLRGAIKVTTCSCNVHTHHGSEHAVARTTPHVLQPMCNSKPGSASHEHRSAHLRKKRGPEREHLESQPDCCFGHREPVNTNLLLQRRRICADASSPRGHEGRRTAGMAGGGQDSGKDPVRAHDFSFGFSREVMLSSPRPKKGGMIILFSLPPKSLNYYSMKPLPEAT